MLVRERESEPRLVELHPINYEPGFTKRIVEKENEMKQSLFHLQLGRMRLTFVRNYMQSYQFVNYWRLC